jgi:transposase
VGRPLALVITPGQAHDLTGAEALLARVPTPRRLIADRAYDARRLRDWLAERGCEAVIPPNPTRKRPHAYDRNAYKARNVVEFFVTQPKQLSRHQSLLSTGSLNHISSPKRIP